RPARRGQLAHRLHAALAHDGGELLARLAPARAQVGRLLVGAAARQRDELLDERLARAAARAGPRDGDDLLRGAEALVADGADDVALADAVAVADPGRVGQVDRGRLARPREQGERVGGMLAGAHSLEQQLVAA